MKESQRKVHSIHTLFRSDGYALPYVLMILAVLGLFVPVLMNINSTRAMTDLKQKNDKIKVNFEESLIESYIQYLINLSSQKNNKLDQSDFTSYPGIRTQPQKIILPEGVNVYYTLKVTPPDQKDPKQIYTINVSVMAGGGGVSTDPSDPSNKYAAAETLNYTLAGPTLSNGSGNGGDNGGGNDGDKGNNNGNGDLNQNPLIKQKWKNGSYFLTTDQQAFNDLIPTNPVFPITTSKNSFSALLRDRDSQIQRSNSKDHDLTISIQVSSSSFTLDQSLISYSYNQNIVLYITSTTVSPSQFTVYIPSTILSQTMVLVNGNIDLSGQSFIWGNMIASQSIKVEPNSSIWGFGTMASNPKVSNSKISGFPYFNHYNYQNGAGNGGSGGTNGDGNSTPWSPNPVQQ